MSVSHEETESSPRSSDSFASRSARGSVHRDGFGQFDDSILELVRVVDAVDNTEVRRYFGINRTAGEDKVLRDVDTAT